MSRCLGNQRHWFTERGNPGLYLSHCTRCGAPNPRFRELDEESGTYKKPRSLKDGDPRLQEPTRNSNREPS